jgi:hypothetical protein
LSNVLVRTCHMGWTIRAHIVLSHEREGPRGWFLLGCIAFCPQLNGECVGAVLLGPLVPIYCCLSIALMHASHGRQARVVVSHEQEGLRGWFLLGSLSLQQQWKGKCVGAVLLELLVPIFEFCQLC